jgi:hypothetical protein
VFNQVRAHLEQVNPSLEIHGGNFHPPPSRMLLSRAIMILAVGCILVLLTGDHLFPLLGMQPPEMYLAARQNKVCLDSKDCRFL